MIIGAISGGSIGVLLAIIITVACLFYCLKPYKERRKSYRLPHQNSGISLQFTESSAKSIDSTKIQRESVNESPAEEAKAAINDKQVSTLYFCGNWQA